ncbi:MAG: uracil-DNA glycosylase, partial [Desulfobacterales bacterium]|nr:uracil-DNA glycosylase [Desulfobacterales bacterium]
MDNFFNSLKRKKTDRVFNPWFDLDFENDIDKSSPQQRLNNLKHYFDERINAEYLLVAEALGYQGGHFSGIPMTSERIILGHKSDLGILPTHVSNSVLVRTSKINIKKYGFTEPTATIIWQKLIESKLDTRKFVFWNAFPWHPYDSSDGILSNRTPSDVEIKEGERVLVELLGFIKFKKVIAIGNKAEAILQNLDLNVEKVRHPANGGSKKFR